MKKLSRRELSRGIGAAVVGGAALAVGLKPAKTIPTTIIPLRSRIVHFYPIDTEWSPTLYVPSICPAWQKKFLDEALKRAGFPGGARYKTE